MAKKNQKQVPLTFTEIVLRGDSETIRQALDARTQIDGLLDEREAAYQRISELETQVESIVGEEGIFPFPTPPAAVSAFELPTAKRASKPAAKKVEKTSTDQDPSKETDEAAKGEDEEATESVAN